MNLAAENTAATNDANYSRHFFGFRTCVLAAATKVTKMI